MKIEIREMATADDATAFRTLNEEWITKIFSLEAKDVEILGNQMRTLEKYGGKFCNTEADVIHLMVESIRDELAKGGDPRMLPERTHEIEFWV